MNNQTSKGANYDRVITSAETAARIAREGANFKKLPKLEKGTDTIDVNAGYTVDREGLANNYAIEPEMYYEIPGDRRTENREDREMRIAEIKDINTPGGQGVGLI